MGRHEVAVLRPQNRSLFLGLRTHDDSQVGSKRAAADAERVERVDHSRAAETGSPEPAAAMGGGRYPTVAA